MTPPAPGSDTPTLPAHGTTPQAPQTGSAPNALGLPVAAPVREAGDPDGGPGAGVWVAVGAAVLGAVFAVGGSVLVKRRVRGRAGV
ncbi:hypothetical protein OG216_36520 [Streptomycetaceae bacterium NBC_01309]